MKSYSVQLAKRTVHVLRELQTRTQDIPTPGKSSTLSQKAVTAKYLFAWFLHCLGSSACSACSADLTLQPMEAAAALARRCAEAAALLEDFGCLGGYIAS